MARLRGWVLFGGLVLLGLIAASCSDDGGMTGPEDGVSSLVITPATATFGAVGSTVQFEAAALGPSGSPVAGTDIVWSTVGRGVVDVDPSSGLVTSVGNGTETLIASVGSVQADVTVSVDQVPISLGHETPGPRLGRIGATASLAPVARDANGARITVPSMFTYSSSAPGIVSVDANGIVTGNDFGDATITIARMGLSTDVAVQVAVEEGPVPILDDSIPCAGGQAGPYACDRMDLVAFLPLAGLGAEPEVFVTDVWGWRDSVTLREYALVGRTDGVSFVDVTEPSHPRTIAWMPAAVGPAPTSLAVYRDYAYVVGDGVPLHGVQVFDLTRLREIDRYTVVTEDVRYTRISSGRSISVNAATGRGYVTGADSLETTCDGGLHMLDLGDPARPTFAGCFADPRVGFVGMGFTNSVHCVEYAGPDIAYVGREICVGSSQTAISISDVTDAGAPIAISAAGGEGSFNVSHGWLSEDHRYFFQADEDDEIRSANSDALPPLPTRTFIWDVSDLDAPFVATVHDGPTRATDAQNLVLGTDLYVATGSYGLRIFDVSDPLNPVATGGFDTVPEHDVPSTLGARASYPFFGDGLVYVASASVGLFVLRRQ